MSQTSPNSGTDTAAVTISGGRDPLSTAVLRELYRVDDVATTAELRERLESDPRIDAAPEMIKYRCKHKLHDPGLTQYRNPGQDTHGRNQPLELWLTDRGEAYVEAHAREILPTREETAVPIEDRVADLEAELAMLSRGNIDLGASAAHAEHVSELEDAIADLRAEVDALCEDVDAASEDNDTEYVTQEEMAAERAEIRDKREKWQESITDQLDDKLETMSGRVNQVENSVAMLKSDVASLRDRVGEVEDTVEDVSDRLAHWAAAMRPVYEWFHGEE